MKKLLLFLCISIFSCTYSQTITLAEMYSLYGKSLMEIERNLLPKGWNLFQAKEVDGRTHLYYLSKEKVKGELLPLLTVVFYKNSSQVISFSTYDSAEYLEISKSIQPTYELVSSSVTSRGGISRIYMKDEYFLTLNSDNLILDTGEKIPSWSFILMTGEVALTQYKK